MRSAERSLALLLEERFDKLPPAPYVHGYLVKIAEALKLLVDEEAAKLVNEDEIRSTALAHTEQIGRAHV